MDAAGEIGSDFDDYRMNFADGTVIFIRSAGNASDRTPSTTVSLDIRIPRYVSEQVNNPGDAPTSYKLFVKYKFPQSEELRC